MTSSELNELHQLDPYDFEYLVADVWEKRGWDTEVLQQSNDMGIDVIARKEDPINQTHVIQAKRYGPQNKVGGPDIQQYASLLQQRPEADSVVVVTTSDFTGQAQQLAQNLNVKLVNGKEFAEMLEETGRKEEAESVEEVVSQSERSLWKSAVLFLGGGAYLAWESLGENIIERFVGLLVVLVMAYVMYEILLVFMTL